MTIISVQELEELIWSIEPLLSDRPAQFQIIDNHNLVIRLVRTRTWRELWLSWPWQPWKIYLNYSVPDNKVYITRMPGGPVFYVAHPETAQAFRKILETMSRVQ